MIEIECDPPIQSAEVSAPFSQKIVMADAGRTIGVTHWHSPAEGGIMQILDLTITPEHRRCKHGVRLLRQAIEQATALHRQRGSKLRRVYFGLAQKTEVVGRAFLTYGGFQHVGTMNGLYRDQDLMFYVKSLD